MKTVKFLPATLLLLSSMTVLGAVLRQTDHNVTDDTQSAANVAYSGGAAWSGVGNVYARDRVYATVNSTYETDQLWCTDFGFAIPTGATILGISATYIGDDIPAVPIAGPPSPYGIYLQLISSAGALTGTALHGNGQLFNGATSKDITSTFGSSTDLWGATLTPAVVNSSSFGIANWSDYDSTMTSVETKIDVVEMTVYYQTTPLHVQSQTRRGTIQTRKLGN